MDKKSSSDEVEVVMSSAEDVESMRDILVGRGYRDASGDGDVMTRGSFMLDGSHRIIWWPRKEDKED